MLASVAVWLWFDMQVIDTHAHVIPDCFPPLPASMEREKTGWPALEKLAEGRVRMLIDGREFRVLDAAYFDLNKRLELMDKEGIDIQIVSPLPELLGYWLDTDIAVELANLTNAAAARMQRAAPGRIYGIGMLPLQSIQASLDMIPELIELGLKGIEVGSNVNGQSIADPMFDPIWSALSLNNLCVLVHGIRPAGIERLIGPGILVNTIAIPQDATLAIASFMTTDVLAKHPDLRLGFVHAGGSIGALIDRMDFVWRNYPALGKTTSVSPRDYIRRFYFDTVTYSVPYLKYLLEVFGENRLFCGTDGPTSGTQYDCKNFIGSACEWNEVQMRKLLSDNAKQFFGLID